MKTAEEWFKFLEVEDERSNDRFIGVAVDEIKKIQLDAYKAGMTEAATLHTNKVFKHVNDFREAILTARDNKTTV